MVLDNLDGLDNKHKVIITICIVILSFLFMFKQAYFMGADAACRNSGGTLFDSPEVRCIDLNQVDICKDCESGVIQKKQFIFNYTFVGGVE